MVTAPAVKSPELEMLAALEFSVQFGEAGCEEPSLKIAVAVNRAELFSASALGPLIARLLKDGTASAMVTALLADLETPPDEYVAVTETI